MPDAPRTRLPTPRPHEDLEEALPPEVAPWTPPEAGDAAGLPWEQAEPKTPSVPAGDPGAPAAPEAGRETAAALEEGEALAARWPEAAPETRSPEARPQEAPAWPWPEARTERGPLPGKPTPPLDLPLPVLVLVEQATRVPEVDRPDLASRLNALLEQMAREGGDRQVADTFHRLLEGGKLEGLVDAQGRSCRAVAVEALLALGFPYALEVRPEDLEHLRASSRRQGQGVPFGREVPLAVVVVGLLGQLLAGGLDFGGPGSLVTVQVGLSLLASMALWVAPPGSPVYRVGLGLLATLSGFALVLSLVPGVPAGLWAGLAGLVAAFLAALRKS